MKPVFFPTPASFRAWLSRHNRQRNELWVGFYKRSSGKPSITWPESVDRSPLLRLDRRHPQERRGELCDPLHPAQAAQHLERRQHQARHGNSSPWDACRPPVSKPFAARSDDRSAIYSYEQRKHAQLDPADEKRFRAETKAWKFFQAQPPGYRQN